MGTTFHAGIVLESSLDWQGLNTENANRLSLHFKSMC